MSYQQIYKPYREEVRERYPLVMERIGRILEEETVSEPFRGYFRNAAGFVMKLYKEQEEISRGTFFNRSLS